MKTEKEKEEILGMRLISGALGFFLLAFSVPCVGAMIHDVFIAAEADPTGAIIVGGFFSVVGIGALWMIYYAFRTPKEEFSISREVEREILQAARDNGGRVTAVELSLGTVFSIAECEEALLHMAGRGITVAEIRDDGTLDYVFPALTPKVGEDAAVRDDDAVLDFDARLEAATAEADRADEVDEAAEETTENAEATNQW